MLKKRPLGRTSALISEIGFGCGNVGGLMIRADPGERVRAVARAIELGINYFDTAAQYGDGESERKLGAVLAELKPDVLVGTKLRLGPEDIAGGHAAIRSHFEASLSRLGRDSVDILYYHGRVRSPGGPPGRGGGLTPEEVLGPLLDSFRRFREERRVRFLAFTGLGDTEAVLEVIRAGVFDTFHCYFSAVNPSAGYPVSADFEPQDMGRMIDHAAAAGMGAIAIRILAAGALGGEEERHPLAGGTSGALISGTDYESDVQRAAHLRPIADELDVALPELAIRFALSKPGVASALVGFSSLEQIEVACRAAEAGPLPAEVVGSIARAGATAP
jgi:aryl-alcohol dehydrogenase-like predicted oxidoreductase